MTRARSTFAVVSAVALVGLGAALVARPRPRPTASHDARPAAMSASPAASAPAPSATTLSEPPPARVAWSEPHGDRAPLDAVVRFGFDGAIDRAAVEASFAIDPLVEGELTWEDDVLTFRPKRLAPVTSYKAEVSVGRGDGADKAHAAFRARWVEGAAEILYIWETR